MNTQWGKVLCFVLIGGVSVPRCYLSLLFWDFSFFARQRPHNISHLDQSWKGHQFEVLRLK